jgi:hypothetical protein
MEKVYLMPKMKIKMMIEKSIIKLQLIEYPLELKMENVRAKYFYFMKLFLKL